MQLKFCKSVLTFTNNKTLSTGLIYKEDRHRLMCFEIIGIILMFIATYFLNFLYKWSGGTMLSILTSSVNESAWEHIKIFIIPYVALCSIEIIVLVPPFRSFIVAKVTGLYLMIILMITFFYCNVCFLHTLTFMLDTLISISIALISHAISYILIIKFKNLYKLFDCCILLLVVLFIFYIAFTFYPPQLELFKDPVTGTYGIPKKTLPYERYINARNV